jgi:hypothetical protein
MTAIGSRHGRDHREAPIPEEDNEDDDGEEAADQDGIAHARDRFLDELRQVVDAVHPDAGRQRLRQRHQHAVHARLEVEDVGAELLGDAHRHRVATVAGDQHVRSGAPA